jgi:hypothetical protein
MDGDYLSTKCYFIEKNDPSRDGEADRAWKFLKIGRLSDALVSGVRDRLVSSARDRSCHSICFQGVWDDGIISSSGNHYLAVEKYREIFCFFRSLRLSPHVFIEAPDASGERPGNRVERTIARIREFLDVAAANGLSRYWRHGVFELVRPPDLYDDTFLEIYSAAHGELRAFSSKISMGFRVGAASAFHALGLLEEALILCKNNGCVPDFVTLDVSGSVIRFEAQAREAIHVIHDTGANVKDLYVGRDAYRVASGVCEEFGIRACA